MAGSRRKIRKGETLKEALFSEVKQETWLGVVSPSLSAHIQGYFQKAHISILYLCTCHSKNVALYNEQSEFVFWNTEVA